MSWALEWKQKRGAEGHLLEMDYVINLCVPTGGYKVMVFRTKREAKEFAQREFGYFEKYPELLQLNGLMPRPVRVRVTVEKV